MMLPNSQTKNPSSTSDSQLSVVASAEDLTNLGQEGNLPDNGGVYFTHSNDANSNSTLAPGINQPDIHVYDLGASSTQPPMNTISNSNIVTRAQTHSDDGADANSNSTLTPGINQQDIPHVYDLGASSTQPPMNTISNSNIMTRAQKPPFTAANLKKPFRSILDKKKIAKQSGQAKSQYLMEQTKNGNDGGSIRKENISLEELQMKMDHLEKQENYQKRKIQEMEESYDKRIQNLEENHSRKVEELEAAQQEMMSLIDRLAIPPGTGDAGLSVSDVTTNENNIQETWLDQPLGDGRGGGRRSFSYSVLRNYEMVFGSNSNSSDEESLQRDTFSLMMISKVWSRSWAIGFAAFLFQMVLGSMIAFDQISLSVDSSLFDVPFKVEAVVRVGQFFSIILCLATQSDILTAILSVIILSRGSSWDTVIGEGGNKSCTLWLIRILLPNLLKFLQGLLVVFVCFVIIVQSDNIIDLLKDFTALMVVSETDNILFHLASYGYLGRALKEETVKVTNTSVPLGHSASNLRSSVANRYEKATFSFRSFALFGLFTSMFGGWLLIMQNQLNGKYFYEKYPNCTATNSFELAKKHFGDGKCYGGVLNRLECDFEGGDCLSFNLAFPLCKGDDNIDVQRLVGNGNCDDIFMNAKCDFDGGDCCPYDIINDPSFGDGLCDKEMNYEGCGFDNGDCVAYNRDFPGCPLDVVFDNPSFGDGRCHGGISSSAICRYDNGDCLGFLSFNPNCPLEDLSQIEGNDNVVLGDGICDSGVYNVEECANESGDCKYFQVGQTILIHDQIFESPQQANQIYFSKDLSLDGTTIAFGLYRTDIDGTFNDKAPGFVKVLRYIPATKKWLQIGGNIVGDSDINYFGYRMALSSSGDHITILSHSTGNVFQYISATSALAGNWSKVGQTIVSNDGQIFTDVDISADGSRLVLIDANQIRIYDLESSFGGVQRWVNDDNNIIDVGANKTQSARLQLNSLGGSKLMLDVDSSTKVFHFSPNSMKPWTQLGQEMLSPSYSLSSAVSADGNRIAISSFIDPADDVQGQVRIFDYNSVIERWVQIGFPIVSSIPENESRFGYDITMSSDGNLLVIGSNNPNCQPYPNAFDLDLCKTAFAEIYLYISDFHHFQKVAPNHHSPYNTGHILELADLSDSKHNFGGLHFSMSGNGSMLVISGYDTNNHYVFVEAYDLGALFYTKCSVDYPSLIGDGRCNDFHPYNTGACGFDGGDCTWVPVEGYPSCVVEHEERIGDEICDYESSVSVTLPATTTLQTTHGICVVNSSYASATSTQASLTYTAESPFIGTPLAWDTSSEHDRYELDGVENTPCYNGIFLRPSLQANIDRGTSITVTTSSASTICVFYDHVNYGDGGFSSSLLQDGFISYGVLSDFTWHHYKFDTMHHPFTLMCKELKGGSSYNTEVCGFDGGDCLVEGYPNCTGVNPSWISDGVCNNMQPYNTEACGFDGGDCLVEGYPNCTGVNLGLISNGICNNDEPYNTEACGFDGGDCLVGGYPNCTGVNPSLISNGICNNDEPYNTEACGFDGGDCLVEGYPDCVVEKSHCIGDGICKNVQPYNTEACGFDGGDCAYDDDNVNGDKYSSRARSASLTLPETSTSETIHGICVTNSCFASANSTQASLTYTAVDPVVGEIQAWDDKTHVLNGVENTPCVNGIFLRPSIHKAIEEETLISVMTSSSKSSICVFFDNGNNGLYNGGWPESLLLEGFQSYGTLADFTWSSPYGPAPLTLMCKESTSSSDLYYSDCGTGFQKDYRGTIAITKSGKTCQRWDSESPHLHVDTPWNRPNAGLVANYCRNPTGNSRRAWCYTTDPNTRTEACSVPFCKSSKLDFDCGEGYRGTISVTTSGRTCQRWDSQSPHAHNYTPSNPSDTGLDANYCRNPNGYTGGAWCYTTDPNKRWETCDVPICECWGGLQKEYRGTLNVTANGKTCQRWDSTIPHEPAYTKWRYPDAGLDENYCRNPSNYEEGAWCYTTDPNDRWGLCNVPKCE